MRKTPDIRKLRYVLLLITLSLTFYLWGLTQKDPRTITYTYGISELTLIRWTIMLLFYTEITLFKFGFRRFLTWRTIKKVVYGACLVFIVTIFFLTIGEAMQTLPEVNPLFSNIIKSLRYIGPVISLALFAFLTYS